MRTYEQVTQDIADSRAEADRILAENERITAASIASGQLTPGQQQRWEDLSRAAMKVRENQTALANERDQIVAERMQRMERIASGNVRTESGDGSAAAEHNRAVYFTRSNAAPDLSAAMAAGGTSTRAGGEKLRDEAMRSIDGWAVRHHTPPEYQEAAARLVANVDDRYARGVAEHIARLSHPDYCAAFNDYARDGWSGVGSDRMAAVRAALNEGTTTQGGFMVPPYLDPAIVLTNNGATNPIRAISTVKTIATQTWKGITSAGVTAEWTAEAAEVADATPTVGQPTITPVRADAYIQASRETLEDTNIGVEVARLFADARDRLEATAFAVGTGSTQPKGVFTAVAGVTASRVAGSSGAAGAADFVLADIYALKNALPPRYRPNSSWVGEQTTLNKIRRFGEGTTANSAFWADLAVDTPPLLLGRPAYESSEVDNTIVSGSNDDVLMIGDFRKGYYIVDRIGMEILFEPLVKGASRRPTGEVAWVAFWRTSADAVDTNGFRLLRL